MLIKGGIITPSYFLKILEIARSAGNTTISFGSRQDIIFNLPEQKYESITNELDKLNFEYAFKMSKDGNMPQNIVSSFVSSDIESSTQWLNSGNYTQIIDLFQYQHKLRVNIADPKQSMVPLFFGHINFVASPNKHYWFVYLRLNPENALYQVPVLVYSTDIPEFAKQIELKWNSKSELSLDSLTKEIIAETKLNTKAIDAKLVESKSFSSDYEGFGRMYESDKFWAGFYWRNNKFDIHFLEQLCALSLATGLAKIAITPWKSFLVKNIDEKDMLKWQTMLGKNGITMRHSAFDLNWHLPLQNKSALRLKNHIVKEFDKRNVCVHGLTFGIVKNFEMQFCSILIKENKVLGMFDKLDIIKTYTISYAKQFNPNSCSYISYVQACPYSQLDKVLAELILKYYMQQDTPDYNNEARKQFSIENEKYYCPNCLTEYLPELGCAHNKIESGVLFKHLPETYCCPVCETEKLKFITKKSSS